MQEMQQQQQQEEEKNKRKKIRMLHGLFHASTRLIVLFTVRPISINHLGMCLYFHRLKHPIPFFLAVAFYCFAAGRRSSVHCCCVVPELPE